MKKLGIGIQRISKLINENFVLVDKTEQIWKLIDSGEYYFLSRPRRFGKSLLVDTLKEIFSGNKKLFEGLWIYNNWEFEKFPVLHLDFTKLDYKNIGLNETLNDYLIEIAEKNNIKLVGKTYSLKFNELIKKLGQEKPITILIDEYDKPVIDFLENEKIDQAAENRDILKNFYQGIKSLGEYIRFFFITGVSKFSRVSIFSDLNHLSDITIFKSYSTLLGFTEDEIKKYYSDHLIQLSDELGLSQVELLDKIKLWYNGYSWDGAKSVYNPFSLLSLFNNQGFNNYWFETGTPTFLVKKIKETDEHISSTDTYNEGISDIALGTFDIFNLDMIALMFQTGYLTIKKFSQKNNNYFLDFPNKEVRDSFYNFALSHYSSKNQSNTERIVDRLVKYLESNKTSEFMIELKSLFSSIAVKDLEKVKSYEGFYHSIIYIVLKIIGINISCEVQSNFGITDAVVKTSKFIYIIEFKIGKAEVALKQIEDKKYFEPYLSDQREIILFGIGFDKEKRNIESHLVEKLKRRKLCQKKL